VDSNGYDARSEDAAIRTELRELDERQTKASVRIADAGAQNRTTIDRLAVALGRLSTLEMKLDALLAHFKVTL
jgi:hypothetical protein